MKWFERLKKRIRRHTGLHSFTCDGCGAELFDYPTHRLCDACEKVMRFNDGRTCEKCGRKTLAEGVCLSCKSRVPHFTKGISPFVYRGESAAFVNRIKAGTPTLAYYFAEKMANSLIEGVDGVESFFGEGEDALLVIPVPLTRERRRQRGYNQAELLAEWVCEVLSGQGIRVELRADVLEKKRETAQQKHMDYHSRMENVLGAYHIHNRKACRGRTVVLVDDVMTTGATGSECAARLLAAGAEKVIFLVGAALPEQK